MAFKHEVCTDRRGVGEAEQSRQATRQVAANNHPSSYARVTNGPQNLSVPVLFCPLISRVSTCKAANQGVRRNSLESLRGVIYVEG
jgi:hypothetical protein